MVGSPVSAAQFILSSPINCNSLPCLTDHQSWGIFSMVACLQTAQHKTNQHQPKTHANLLFKYLGTFSDLYKSVQIPKLIKIRFPNVVLS